MSLRLQALLTLGGAFLALFAGLYLLTRTSVLRTFREYEDHEARRTVQRVLGAVDADLANLKGTARDWAAWDDTYRFMLDRNADYLRSNLLVDTTAINNRLNLMVYVDHAGRIIFEQAYDFSRRQRLPVPTELSQHISPDRLIIDGRTKEEMSGVLQLGERVLLVSAEPILTSERQGPPRGTLIFGRYLDSGALQRISSTTLSSLTAHGLADSRLPAVVREALVSASSQDTVVTRPLDDQSIAGYALLKDVYGRPALVLAAHMQRDVYTRARGTMRNHMIALSVMGIAFGGLVLFLLEHGLLSRVRTAERTVSGIAESGDMTVRIPVAGSDELSRLCYAINGMLQAQQDTQTIREQARVAHDQIEMRLRQAHTTEAMARLAEGIAEDFNSLLIVIGGRVATLRATPQDSGRQRHELGLIQRALERAAALVEQLHAFSRRQALDRTEQDLNTIVSSMSETIRQLLGSQIELRLSLDPELNRVRAARSEIEQIIMNLATNARDAMQTGGRLTIETRNVVVDESFTRDHPGARPGPHVMLSMIDTGIGMDVDMRDRAFQGFKTTKPFERGAGLGLAIVYSLTKHLGGYVCLDSTPGRGTRFMIYLPRTAAC